MHGGKDNGSPLIENIFRINISARGDRGTEVGRPSSDRKTAGLISAWPAHVSKCPWQSVWKLDIGKLRHIKCKSFQVRKGYIKIENKCCRCRCAPLIINFRRHNNKVVFQNSDRSSRHLLKSLSNTTLTFFNEFLDPLFYSQLYLMSARNGLCGKAPLIISNGTTVCVG